ncbi:hypothetical protein B566_EDAN002063 [Ephemera danica]|nr:hypothetical protein B566_EDAN002063 [Ephemera danica]
MKMSASVVRSLTGLGRTSLSLKYLPVSTSNFSPSVTSTNSRWHNRSAAAFISYTSRRHKITGSCGIVSHFCTTAEKVATQATGDATSSETSESTEIKKLNELLVQERKKAAEFQDKYMRALAENQNTISRMRKQIEDTKVYGIQGLVKDLLEFSDVLQSALESIPKEEVTESNIHLKNLHV